MYTLIRDQLSGTRTRTDAAPRGRGRLRVSSTVVFLGLTSLFTDISSEMVSAILPLYFVFHLGFTPFAFGVLDGLYQGSSALIRIAGGFTADRWRRHKEVAATGYGLSALCKLGLLMVGGAWGAISAVILLDRTGKGVRTAPRDALISLSSDPAALGTAFGVHRALGTAGALLGPLVAFWLLALAPRAYDAVFLTSFCFAIVGLGVLLLFVQGRPAEAPAASAERVNLRSALRLLALPRLLLLVLAGGLLGLVTISDGFIYLVMQKQLDFSIGYFPLLYIGTACAYFVLAVPAGWLADRIGRAWVFVGGYVLLLAVYTALLQSTLSMWHIAVYLALFGAFYAATDGVLMALASAVVPPALRSSGLALVTTATSLSRLAGSVLFGALWTWWGVDAAIGVMAAGLVTAIVFASLALIRSEGETASGHVAAS
jgi:MFS family permease